MKSMNESEYRCEWCEGTVREKILAREVFRHTRGFVILENVPVGCCDKCGRKYYGAKILHRVEDIVLKREKADHTEQVLVAHA